MQNLLRLDYKKILLLTPLSFWGDYLAHNVSGLVAHKLSGLFLIVAGGEMGRTRWLQETKQMRFEEAYSGWTESRLTQEEAAQLLGVCDRSFRRYINRDSYSKIICHNMVYDLPITIS